MADLQELGYELPRSSPSSRMRPERAKNSKRPMGGFSAAATGVARGGRGGASPRLFRRAEQTKFHGDL